MLVKFSFTYNGTEDEVFPGMLLNYGVATGNGEYDTADCNAAVEASPANLGTLEAGASGSFNDCLDIPRPTPRSTMCSSRTSLGTASPGRSPSDRPGSLHHSPEPVGQQWTNNDELVRLWTP